MLEVATLRTPPPSQVAGLGRRAGRVSRRLCDRAAGLWQQACAAARKRRAARVLQRRPAPLQLCLGSGAAPIAGWINVDRDARADLRLDVRFGLPLPDASVSLVYSEHLLEHLTLDEGVMLFRECRRLLAKDGVLRIATPDLAAIVAAFLGDWRDQDWLRWPEYGWVDTRVRALNQAFHGWGHRYLYDEAELTLRLREAGFDRIARCALGESARPELAGLETRRDSSLIVEASVGSR